MQSRPGHTYFDDQGREAALGGNTNWMVPLRKRASIDDWSIDRGINPYRGRPENLNPTIQRERMLGEDKLAQQTQSPAMPPEQGMQLPPMPQQQMPDIEKIPAHLRRQFEALWEIEPSVAMEWAAEMIANRGAGAAEGGTTNSGGLQTRTLS